MRVHEFFKDNTVSVRDSVNKLQSIRKQKLINGYYRSTKSGEAYSILIIYWTSLMFSFIYIHWKGILWWEGGWFNWFCIKRTVAIVVEAMSRSPCGRLLSRLYELLELFLAYILTLEMFVVTGTDQNVNPISSQSLAKDFENFK